MLFRLRGLEGKLVVQDSRAPLPRPDRTDEIDRVDALRLAAVTDSEITSGGPGEEA